VVELPAPSPFALPLMVERLREQLTTEKLKDRLDRLLAEAEAQLAATSPPVAAPAAAALRHHRGRRGQG
jgi:ATP-dependent Lhr-like helicase